MRTIGAVACLLLCNGCFFAPWFIDSEEFTCEEPTELEVMADAFGRHFWSAGTLVEYRPKTCTLVLQDYFDGRIVEWTIVPKPAVGYGTEIALDDAVLVGAGYLQEGVEIKYWGTNASKRLYGIRAFTGETVTGPVQFRTGVFDEIRANGQKEVLDDIRFGEVSHADHTTKSALFTYSWEGYELKSSDDSGWYGSIVVEKDGCRQAFAWWEDWTAAEKSSVMATNLVTGLNQLGVVIEEGGGADTTINGSPGKSVEGALNAMPVKAATWECGSESSFVTLMTIGYDRGAASLCHAEALEHITCFREYRD